MVDARWAYTLFAQSPIPCDTANAGVYQWRGRGLGASLLLRCCFTVREHTYTCRCQSNLLTGCQFTYDA